MRRRRLQFFNRGRLPQQETNEMTSAARRIVLLAARFVAAAETINAQWNEQAEIDAAFDGGEFSGPAVGRAIARESNAAARRLGFASADVAWDVADRVLVHAPAPEPAPEPERCAYCFIDPVDPKHDPFCSIVCSIAAETDR